MGVFNYHGRRKDDPNDRVDHEHRRELRGLRVLGSWLNDADRRAANTLDMYVTEEDGRSYVRHYIIDMGSALGSGSWRPHQPKHGNEYMVDFRTILRSVVSLGLYRKKWEEPVPMPYVSLGYFENETFRPGGWVPDYPNPAFERCTNRDGYWGAKIVMAFGDDEIRAIVERGKLLRSGGDGGADPPAGGAAGHDRALLVRAGQPPGPLCRGGRPASVRRSRGGGRAGAARFTAVAVFRHRCGRGSAGRAEAGGGDGRSHRRGGAARASSCGYRLQSRTGEAGKWSKNTRVYLYKHEDGRLQLVWINREE